MNEGFQVFSEGEKKTVPAGTGENNEKCEF